ncbi:hypothetical protein GGF31_008075 [Allomyces arbusculus]|nr:hypothetical protein GGF31_008075 [Allomyces arbusculus]
MGLSRHAAWPWLISTGPSHGPDLARRAGAVARGITGDTFVWSPSTFLWTLLLAIYASTTWRALHLFAVKRSWFYAGILVLIAMQLYDINFTLFCLFQPTCPAANWVLDYFACMVNMVLFSIMNLQRYRQLAGSLWPRVTTTLWVSTILFSAYWFAFMVYGWVFVARNGYFGDDQVYQLFAAGYLFDAALNTALSLAFLVRLRHLTRDNHLRRTGFNKYMLRAQTLLLVEAGTLTVANLIHLFDVTFDPLWLLVYLSQSVRMSAYCTLLQLLTKIMVQRLPTSPTAAATNNTESHLASSITTSSQGGGQSSSGGGTATRAPGSLLKPNYGPAAGHMPSVRIVEVVEK